MFNSLILLVSMFLQDILILHNQMHPNYSASNSQALFPQQATALVGCTKSTLATAPNWHLSYKDITFKDITEDRMVVVAYNQKTFSIILVTKV